MKFLFLKKVNKKAFSLIELSIVIVVISILLSGALSIVTTTSNKAKVKTTNNNIDEIYKALKVYLLANKALPCPASITAVKSTNTNYGKISGTQVNCSESGVYGSTTNSNIVYGMVPVKDLGLSSDVAEDGFGSKFAYVVDKRFTISGSSGFGANSNNSGLIKVEEITSTGIVQNNTMEAIFLIISYGANKSGAFNANSSSQNSASTDAYEIVNGIVPTGATTATMGDNSAPYRIYSQVERSDVFDDVILYKTRNMLVIEANAFDLIKCPSGKTESLYGSTITWSKEGKYGEVVVASTECPPGYRATVKYPTKRCNTFGQWQDGVVDPCTKSGTIPECSGGDPVNIEVSGKTYKVHTFTSSSTFNCPKTIDNAEILVVGGGGGGGGDGGGGGGGGGIVHKTSQTIPSKNYVVVVGRGGIGNMATSGGSSSGNGLDSSIDITGVEVAKGGGGGATRTHGGRASNGGSGGGGAGGSVSQTNSGLGVSGQGSNGGKGYNDNFTSSGGGSSGGGGGGKNAAGIQAAEYVGGSGGEGYASSISGTSYVYSSGGGGGRSGGAGTAGLGGNGAGKGGTGSTAISKLGGAATGYGSGGGGGGQSSLGGSGKQGIVIIRYEK